MMRPGSDRKRCAGTSTPVTTIVHEPVPAKPLTYQSSLMVISDCGTMKSPWSISFPASSNTTAPSSSQSARSQPEPKGHTPSSRYPSAVRTALPRGPMTAETTASGLLP